ncbi:MAG: insulinase family protein [Phycisphaera sp.]|nr:insulinase family protein [Phycisphaera sp.]
MPFHHHRLPNGLTVLAESMPDAHTSAIGFFVATGARDELPGVMGVSHFLEHMMFKGTARRTAEDVNREFDEIGANYNAFTSEELTAYYAQVLPEHFSQATDLLADILRPALRESDFDMEKKVILEEIGMYDDRPQWRLHDALNLAHFDSHPLGHRVLGTTQTVGGLQVEQMRDYFNERYSPDNIVVAAAGRLNFKKLVDELGTLTQTWKPTGASRMHGQPPATGEKRTERDARVNRHYLAMMMPAPGAQDEKRYAAKVLADALGDEDGSRLYWSLIDPGLADEVSFDFNPQDRTGSYIVFASCDTDRADEVEEVLHQSLDTFADHIEDDELERVKNKLATAATLQGETPMGRMSSLGGQWLYLQEHIPLEEELARLTRVTVADLVELVNEYPFQPRTVVRLTPA